MKKVLPTLIVTTVLFFSFSAMAADKVIVIPLGGSNVPKTDKLYGKGRPGTGLLTHTNPNGYCTSPSGVKFALSDHWALWANADDVCPSGTWVCSVDELLTSDACPIVPITTASYQNCNLSWGSNALQSSLNGWLADAEPRFYLGMYRSSAAAVVSNKDVCYRERAWCCWK